MAADPRLVGSVPVFVSMDADERQALAAVMDEASFADGEVVYRMGDPGGTCHVITSGQVEVSLRADDGEKVVLELLGRAASPAAGGMPVGGPG